jgi:hypothetical protein
MFKIPVMFFGTLKRAIELIGKVNKYGKFIEQSENFLYLDYSKTRHYINIDILNHHARTDSNDVKVYGRP